MDTSVNPLGDIPRQLFKLYGTDVNPLDGNSGCGYTVDVIVVTIRVLIERVEERVGVCT